jgi:DNA helicase II / ATP-dependent DNA helicase PcrA
MTDFLHTLNDRQLEAVKQVEGPVLIMAGAGSGKTKALTCRIAYMLSLGIRPSEILAITFTNKAAKEMRDRVHSLVGPAADKIWMYTFHSFGARFLRREINNYPPYTDKFTIYDSDDSKQLVKNVLKELNLDDKQFQPRSIQSSISTAKNQLLSPQAFRRQAGGNFYNQKAAEKSFKASHRLSGNKYYRLEPPSFTHAVQKSPAPGRGFLRLFSAYLNRFIL